VRSVRENAMPRIRYLRPVIAFALVALCVTIPLRTARAGFAGTEEESRFLPGLYYFHKGCDYYRRGSAETAIEMWELAASWAVKDAQYDLGIAYFRGRGVAIDKPRGLAWLALAAERKDEEFERSLAAAWDDATAEDHAKANEIWRGLRGKYGDATALVRAENRYKYEVDNITGSRVGTPGHVQIWTNSSAGFIDVATYKASIQALADRNFGKLPTGTVDVGPLTSILDEPPQQ
jgi:hypothetical protein